MGYVPSSEGSLSTSSNVSIRAERNPVDGGAGSGSRVGYFGAGAATGGTNSIFSIGVRVSAFSFDSWTVANCVAAVSRTIFLIESLLRSNEGSCDQANEASMAPSSNSTREFMLPSLPPKQKPIKEILAVFLHNGGVQHSFI
jgi:hypothetical protein